MALRAGASRVYGCELSSVLCEVATTCVAQNARAHPQWAASASGRLTVIHAKSTDLVVSGQSLIPRFAVSLHGVAVKAASRCLATIHAPSQTISP